MVKIGLGWIELKLYSYNQARYAHHEGIGC